MKALSLRNTEPEEASRPFDENRDGFVMGEGAGVLVLEELEHARRRSAPIYCELAGYGCTADAHHMTQPHPEGREVARAMKIAMRCAKVRIGKQRLDMRDDPTKLASEASPSHRHGSSLGIASETHRTRIPSCRFAELCDQRASVSSWKTNRVKVARHPLHHSG